MEEQKITNHQQFILDYVDEKYEAPSKALIRLESKQHVCKQGIYIKRLKHDYRKYLNYLSIKLEQDPHAASHKYCLYIKNYLWYQRTFKKQFDYAGDVVYVGKTTDIEQRTAKSLEPIQYKNKGNKTFFDWFNYLCSAMFYEEFIEVPDATAKELDDLETDYIKQYKPIMNISKNPHWINYKHSLYGKKNSYDLFLEITNDYKINELI